MGIVHAGMGEGWIRREEATIAAARRRREEAQARVEVEVLVEPLLPRDEWWLIADFEALERGVLLVAMLDVEYGPCWRCAGMGV